MGREASCTARVGQEAAEVDALLESTTVVLRGALKRRWDIAALQNLSVEGEELRFDADGDAVALVLGEKEAQRWLKKLQTPPPTLAAKLGVSAENPALLIGPTVGTLDPALAEALAGGITTNVREARMLVAVLSKPSELERMAEFHATMICKTVWVVYPKGPGASPSEAEVRTAMRGWGYVDNKTSAVSDKLTATRYVLTQPPAKKRVRNR
ncbi:hypothetical protein [Roseateles saccharophilus]|uniref:Uncharacterized protein n=1 Tax=Roseateles saccharophilus TaxID=304 RepID=A0A4R3VJF1_ROSSA|nr:hypothetical protein [Roseateles saccharophilus]MDG0832870.1 hypothetical protein [Roseateles saccharophilus]TCV04541.1 hypothetical protein EV671_1001297 [Roseateles saccharophilus]